MPRASKFSTQKKDIKAFPFHLLLEAYQRGVAREQEYNRKQYLQLVQRREQEWTDTHEAPYEGNFYDELGGPPPLTLEQRDAAGYLEMEEVIKALGIQGHAPWMLPQLTAYIADTMQLVKDESGLYDAVSTIRGWINGGTERENQARKGIALLFRFPRRGAFVKNQYSEEMKHYSAVVPLLLMPFKKFRGVQYQQWSLRGLDSMVDSKLLDAMTAEVPELTREELLAIRDQGLQVAANPGEVRDASKTHRLYNIKDTALGGLPDLAVTMLTQIWVCSPHIRTEFMICDPKNWDNLPEALLDIKLFEPLTIKKNIKKQDTTLEDLWG